MAEHDAVIVGSGINSLACGALLARAGWNVCVLERNDWLGGAMHTAEITEPGFTHDVLSAWHPLWVGGAAHAELGDELAARGLEYLNTELPTATAFPDGEAAFLLRTAEGNAGELGPEWGGVLERFFPNADLAFGVLGTELWSGSGLGLATKAVRHCWFWFFLALAVFLPWALTSMRAGSATWLSEAIQTYVPPLPELLTNSLPAAGGWWQTGWSWIGDRYGDLQRLTLDRNLVFPTVIVCVLLALWARFANRDRRGKRWTNPIPVSAS